MSALLDDAARALARLVTPNTRIVIVLGAEMGEDDPITLRMRVSDDCGLEPAELAALLVKACDMALDPAARSGETSATVQ